MKRYTSQNIRFYCIVAGLLIILFCSSSLSAKDITLSGRIFNSATKKTICFATVIIPELRVKARTSTDGSFKMNIPKAGSYAVMVRSSGLALLKTSINIKKDTVRDFWLNPARIRGASITITDERAAQKVSRRTMTREELKSTPASFGDAISALTALPGVNSTSGFFGSLVIRGMNPMTNRYYIDDLLIYDPQHFWGLHSVINTNLMDRVDLYASAFPNQFGGPLAAVIDIKTIDDVKKFGGYVDAGILSTASLISFPITRDTCDGETIKKENAGYIIASGRYSTFENLVYLYRLYNYVRGKNVKLDEIPGYYDYQLKSKFYINKNHALSMLFIGGYDGLKLGIKRDDQDEGSDPLFSDIKLKHHNRFNSLGLYYTYSEGIVKNRVTVYGSFKDTYNYFNLRNIDAPDWMKDFNQTIKPDFYGVKDTFSLKWIKNHAQARANIEYACYRFRAEGKQLAFNEGSDTGFDINDPDSVIVRPLDLKSTNHVVGGYFDNEFTFGGLKFVPGFRTDYLKRIKKTTFDPRIMISYEFQTDTTISAAGGQYSSFLQTNPFLFNSSPEMVKYSYIDPEKAYHSVIGVEQVFGLYSFELEGYYNKFFDLVQEYPHYKDGKYYRGINSGESKVFGFEIMLKKEKAKNANDFFGHISYTWNRAKAKSGITGNFFDRNGNDSGYRYDPNGNNWFTSDNEREHTLKAVMGYTYGKHTLSTRFQMYSARSYTPIIGSHEDPLYPGRHIPEFDTDNPNSKKLLSTHRLDFRYTYKTSYEWGYVSWYIEVVNVTRSRSEGEEDWNYEKPYSANGPDKNPTIDSEKSIFIPNFGVEVKF